MGVTGFDLNVGIIPYIGLCEFDSHHLHKLKGERMNRKSKTIKKLIESGKMIAPPGYMERHYGTSNTPKRMFQEKEKE